jgi:hypothetical protein
MITISRIGVLKPYVTETYDRWLDQAARISARRWWGARPRTSWHRVHSPGRQHQRAPTGRPELIRWSSWLLLQAMQAAPLLPAIDEQDGSLIATSIAVVGGTVFGFLQVTPRTRAFEIDREPLTVHRKPYRHIGRASHARGRASPARRQTARTAPHSERLPRSSRHRPRTRWPGALQERRGDHSAKGRLHRRRWSEKGSLSWR